MQSSLQIRYEMLEREVELLRCFGNKDCTKMADQAIENDERYSELATELWKVMFPKVEENVSSTMRICADDYELGYN